MRRQRTHHVGAGVILILLSILPPGLAEARASCSSSAKAVGDVFAVGYECMQKRNVRSPAQLDSSASPARDGFSGEPDPIWIKPSACAAMDHLAVCGGTDTLCEQGLSIDNGEFMGGGRAPTGPCAQSRTAAAVGPAPLPQVTPGVALTALRRIGLPALQARTQPEDKTLVNFATIFYTEPEPFTRTVTLLGRQVRIQATPSTFTWHYGDGTSTTTSTPGAPYPAKDVTHEYRDAHATVRTSVDVTYTATFQVAGGPERAIPGSVTIGGPTAPLRISEATAVLSGDRT